MNSKSLAILKQPISALAAVMRWRIRMMACALVVVVTVVTAVQMRHREIKAMANPAAAQLNDFERFLKMVPEFIHNHKDYTDDSFPTPPITLAPLAPFTLLSYPNAQFAWVCCKPIFAVGIFLFCLSMVRRAGVEPMLLACLLVAGAWIWPVLGDVQEGQTNLLMLLPLAAGLWFAQSQRPGQQWIGGLLIALAICIKVTPVIFLAYMAFRMRWRIVSAILVGMGLWLFVVPGILFGWTQNLLWLGQWFGIMIQPYATTGAVRYGSGQSIPSILARFLEHVSAFQTTHGGTATQPVRMEHYVNIADLPEGVVKALTRGILGILGLAGLWWMRRSLPTFMNRRYVLEIGIVAAFMLWASERTWVPHYVSMILPLFAAAMVMSDPQVTRRVSSRACIALCASWVLMWFTTDIAKIFGRNGGEYMRTFGVSLIASVFLVVAIVRASANQPAKNDKSVINNRSP